MMKGSCRIRLWASHSKPPPYLVWCLWVFWKWRCVFYLLRDLTRLRHWGVMQINRWELLVECHHPDKFGVLGSSGSGDLYLICHVTLQGHPTVWSCRFMGGSSSRYVISLSSLVTIGILIVKNASLKRTTTYYHRKKEFVG